MMVMARAAWEFIMIFNDGKQYDSGNVDVLQTVQDEYDRVRTCECRPFGAGSAFRRFLESNQL
jgi:hypothetical protein